MKTEDIEDFYQSLIRMHQEKTKNPSLEVDEEFFLVAKKILFSELGIRENKINHSLLHALLECSSPFSELLEVLGPHEIFQNAA
ncbi:MAG: hypothetical protein IPK68_17790 [Bdellovibrionales bacterium]|nr:hypothetical protein [Bdellovibrionales bacterium]